MNDIEKQVTQSEELQEQVEAATTESDFMADVEKTLVQIRPGQTIVGTVVQITDDEVCVNVGYKADGLVKKADLSSTDVKIGDEIEVEVVKVNDGEGNVLLSQRNIVNRKNWDEIVAKYEAGEFVTGIGKEAVKGGLLADVMGVRTFIPASQLSMRYVEKIAEFVGQEMTLKIIEVDKAKKRIVASRKAVLIAEEAEKKKAIWESLKGKEGEIVKGTVRRLADFGAFVELEPGLDGLVHISQCALTRIAKVEDAVNVGDVVRVKVLDVNTEAKRISLSIREVLEDEALEGVPADDEYGIADEQFGDLSTDE